MNKFILKSKTIIGIVLAAMVQLLPQFGINFTEDDSHLISELWDTMMTVCTLAFAAYGRFVAKENLTFQGSGGGKINCHWVVFIFIFAFFLGGCSILDKIDEGAVEENFTANFLTQYATLKYVEDDIDGGIDVVKAKRVYDKAVSVSKYLKNDIEITVDELEQYVIKQVKWEDLSPADTVAAKTFINYLAFEMKKKISEIEEESGQIQDKLIVAKEIVQIVIDTLEPYQE